MKPVLVCGDAMIDRYWFGDITRISPEAPVPVVSIERTEERQGGAANVSANLKAMGAEVVECYSTSFKIDPVVKLRVIARGQQVSRLDFDRPQDAVDIDRLMGLAESCETVVLSDYGKGALRNVQAIIWRLKKMGKTVIVDPKGPKFERYDGADVLKPNLAEIRELVGAWSGEDELAHKVKAMQRMAGIHAVLLTRGPAGMTLYNGSVRNIPCQAKEVFDVSGAGDTALAAFAASVARGEDYYAAASRANRAAGIAVGRFGTAVVNEAEVFA